MNGEGQLLDPGWLMEGSWIRAPGSWWTLKWTVSWPGRADRANMFSDADGALDAADTWRLNCFTTVTGHCIVIMRTETKIAWISSWVSSLDSFDQGAKKFLRGQDSISEMPCIQIDLNRIEGNFWFALCVLWLLQSQNSRCGEVGGRPLWSQSLQNCGSEKGGPGLTQLQVIANFILSLCPFGSKIRTKIRTEGRVMNRFGLSSLPHHQMPTHTKLLCHWTKTRDKIVNLNLWIFCSLSNDSNVHICCSGH